jgi:LacI family transcriptional regulator
LEISRRNIEIRFQNCVGRTIHGELQRVRLERARRFLIETDIPIPRIGRSVGYSSPSYFIQVFRDEHGMTPAKYRRHQRDGA